MSYSATVEIKSMMAQASGNRAMALRQGLQQLISKLPASEERMLTLHLDFGVTDATAISDRIKQEIENAVYEIAVGLALILPGSERAGALRDASLFKAEAGAIISGVANRAVVATERRRLQDFGRAPAESTKPWPPRWSYVLGALIPALVLLLGIANYLMPRKTETAPVQAGTVIQQGPGSIAQIGGISNQATIVTARPIPRRLSEDQSRAISETITAMPTSLHFFVKTIDGNPEAYSYAEQFQRIFGSLGRAAGSDVILGSFWRPTPVGLLLVAHSETDPIASHATALLERLQSLGVNAEPKVGDWVPTGAVYVVVGAQP